MTGLVAPTPSSIERIQGETGRERILKAALTVFSELGFEGASTRAIASKAGVTQPAIAYFFKNKEEMWKATIDTAFKEMSAAVLSVNLPGKPLIERRRDMISVFVRFAAFNPEWSMFIVHEGLQTGERSQWTTTRWLKPTTHMLFEALTGEPWREDEHDPIAVIELVSFLCHSVLVFAQRAQISLIADVDVTSEAFIERRIEFILAGVDRLIGARSPR